MKHASMYASSLGNADDLQYAQLVLDCSLKVHASAS